MRVGSREGHGWVPAFSWPGPENKQLFPRNWPTIGQAPRWYRWQKKDENVTQEKRCDYPQDVWTTLCSFLSGCIASSCSQNETMEYGWHYMSHCIDGEWVPKYIAVIRIVAEYIGNCGGIYWCNSPNVCLSAAPSLWDTVAKCILAFSKWFYICFATSFKCCYHIHNILQFILTLHT